MPDTRDVLNAYQDEVMFAEKVISYSLQKFGLIYREFKKSARFTEDIGNAVVIVQLHIRGFLRDHLFRCSEKLLGVTDPHQGLTAIQQLINFRPDQPLDKYPVVTATLGYLALLAELVIFLDSAGLPVPLDWFAKIWSVIYEKRLRQRLADKGGWPALGREASRLCEQCPNWEEIAKELGAVEHPYAEVHPLLETSFKNVDPFFMCSAVRIGGDIPRRAGLSREVLARLPNEMPASQKTTGKA